MEPFLIPRRQPGEDGVAVGKLLHTSSPLYKRALTELFRLQCELHRHEAGRVLPMAGPGTEEDALQSSVTPPPSCPPLSGAAAGTAAATPQPLPRCRMQKAAKPPSRAKKGSATASAASTPPVTLSFSRKLPPPPDRHEHGKTESSHSAETGEEGIASGFSPVDMHSFSNSNSDGENGSSGGTGSSRALERGGIPAAAVDGVDSVLATLRRMRRQHKRELERRLSWRHFADFRDVVKQGGSFTASPGTSVASQLPFTFSQPPHGVLPLIPQVSSEEEEVLLGSVAATPRADEGGCESAYGGSSTVTTTATAQMAQQERKQADGGRRGEQQQWPPSLSSAANTSDVDGLLPLVCLTQCWTLHTSVWRRGEDQAVTALQHGGKSATTGETAADRKGGAEVHDVGHLLLTKRLCELLSAWNYLSTHITATSFHRPQREGAGAKRGGGGEHERSPAAAALLRSASSPNDSTDTTAVSAAEAEPPCVPDHAEAAAAAVRLKPSRDTCAGGGEEEEEEEALLRIATHRLMEIYPTGLPTALTLEEIRRRVTSRPEAAEEGEERESRAAGEHKGAHLSHTYVQVSVTQHGVRVVGDAAETLSNAGLVDGYCCEQRRQQVEASSSDSISTPEADRTPTKDSLSPSHKHCSCSMAPYEQLNRRHLGVAELNRSGCLHASVLRALLNDALITALASAPAYPTLEELIGLAETAVHRQRGRQMQPAVALMTTVGADHEVGSTSTSRSRCCRKQSVDSDGVRLYEEEGDGSVSNCNASAAAEVAESKGYEQGSAAMWRQPASVYRLEHMWSTTQSEAQDRGTRRHETLSFPPARPYDILGLAVRARVVEGSSEAQPEPPRADEAASASPTPTRVVDLVYDIFARVRLPLPPPGSEEGDTPQAAERPLVPEEMARWIVLELFPEGFIFSPRTDPSLAVSPLVVGEEEGEESVGAVSGGSSTWADRSSAKGEEQAVRKGVVEGGTAAKPPCPAAPDTRGSADAEGLSMQPVGLAASAGAVCAAVPERPPQTQRTASVALGEANEAERGVEEEGVSWRIAWPVAEHTKGLNAAVEAFCKAEQRQRAVLDALTTDWGVCLPATDVEAPRTMVGARSTAATEKKNPENRCGSEASNADSSVAAAALDREWSSHPLQACFSARAIVATFAKEGLPVIAIDTATASSLGAAAAGPSRGGSACKPTEPQHPQPSADHAEESGGGGEACAALAAAGFYGLLRAHSEAHVQSVLSTTKGNDGGGCQSREAILETVADAFRRVAVGISKSTNQQEQQQEEEEEGKGRRPPSPSKPSAPSAALIREAVVSSLPSAELLPAVTASSETSVRASAVTLYLPDQASAEALSGVVTKAMAALTALTEAKLAATRELERHVAEDWPHRFLPAVVSRYTLLQTEAETRSGLEAAVASTLSAAASRGQGGGAAATTTAVRESNGEKKNLSRVGTRQASHSFPSAAAPALPPPSVAAGASELKCAKGSGKSKQRQPQHTAGSQAKSGKGKRATHHGGGGAEEKEVAVVAGRRAPTLGLTILTVLLVLLGTFFLLTDNNDNNGRRVSPLR